MNPVMNPIGRLSFILLPIFWRRCCWSPWSGGQSWGLRSSSGCWHGCTPMSGCWPHWREWAGGNLGRGRQPCHAELRYLPHYLHMKNGLELGSWRPCGHLMQHHFWFFPLQLSLGLLLVLALVLGWIVDWFASWRCSGFKSEVIFG